MSCLKGDTCNYPSCSCIKPKLATDIIWSTKKEFKEGNLVLAMGQMWECTKAHTSDVFGNDAIVHKVWKEYDYE